MKRTVFYLLIVFLLLLSLSLAQEDPQNQKKQRKSRKIEDQVEFDKLKKKAQECGKGECKKGDDELPKFEKTEGLEKFIKQEHKKMKNPKGLHQQRRKANEFQKKAGKQESQKEKVQNQYFDKVEKDNKNLKPSDINPKQLVKQVWNHDPSKKSSARLLTSSSNQYPSNDEGNSQAYQGQYLYFVRYNNGIPVIYGVKSQNPLLTTTLGTTLTVVSSVSFWSGYYLKQILVSNGVLLAIGQSSNLIILIKIPLDLSTGSILIASATYIMKQGYLSGQSARQKNNRAIIVSQQQIDPNIFWFDQYWYIYQPTGFLQPFASSYGFLPPSSNSNLVRAVWNIGMNLASGDYYFEEYFFANWVIVMDFGDWNGGSSRLYITSYNYDSGYIEFDIQMINAAINIPVSPLTWSYYVTAYNKGYVYNKFSQDDYSGVFRVIAIDWDYPGYDVLFYRFSSSTLASLGSPVSVVYFGQYFSSCLFVKDYAYIVYQSVIKVTTGLDAGVDQPQSYYMSSLHKYNSGTTVNYLIGFGQTNGTIYAPVVILYNISTAGSLTLLTSYVLSTNNAYFLQSYFWDHQALLINYQTNSIVFSVLNPSTSGPMYMGMYYLRLSWSPLCLTPSSICTSTPSLAPVYKHWDQPNTFITGWAEYTGRFTILSSGNNWYLFSSSYCQLQVRKITGNLLPMLSNPVGSASRIDFCP